MSGHGQHHSEFSRWAESHSPGTGPHTEAGKRLDSAWPATHMDRLDWHQSIVAIEEQAYAMTTPTLPESRATLAAHLHDAFHGETEHRYVDCWHKEHWIGKAERLSRRLSALDATPSPDLSGLRREIEALPDVNPRPTVGTGLSTDWPLVKRTEVLAIVDRLARQEPAIDVELERLRRIEIAARKREHAEEVWADAEDAYNNSTNPTFTRTFLQIDRLANERAEAILELRTALGSE
jgi:hypothetical protein